MTLIGRVQEMDAISPVTASNAERTVLFILNTLSQRAFNPE
jgi:hypothetical protein